MKRQAKADVARVMGIRWIWNYTARCWIWEGPAGNWQLCVGKREWLLRSPQGVTYTLPAQRRYEAMVMAGYKIAEIERWFNR